MWFKREQKNRRLRRGHVLDVKLRSDQVRATRTRLALVAVGVTCGTVFGLYLLWRTGEWALDKFVYENATFAIQSVEVQTDGMIAPDQLRPLDGREAGRKSHRTRFGLGERNLEMVPTIESVSVERVLPAHVESAVTEREPIAQVNMPRADVSGGIAVEVFQLDADGFIMKPLDPRSA